MNVAAAFSPKSLSKGGPITPSQDNHHTKATGQNRDEVLPTNSGGITREGTPTCHPEKVRKGGHPSSSRFGRIGVNPMGLPHFPEYPGKTSASARNWPPFVGRVVMQFPGGSPRVKPSMQSVLSLRKGGLGKPTWPFKVSLRRILPWPPNFAEDPPGQSCFSLTKKELPNDAKTDREVNVLR